MYAYEALVTGGKYPRPRAQNVRMRPEVLFSRGMEGQTSSPIHHLRWAMAGTSTRQPHFYLGKREGGVLGARIQSSQGGLEAPIKRTNKY